MFGLLSYGVGRNTGVVACARQVGLEDLQEGSIWRDAVGISASQGPAIFEPCDLGLWVACMQRGEASEMLQQVSTRSNKRSEAAPRWGRGRQFSILVRRPMQQGKTQKQLPSLAWALSCVL